MSIVLYQVIATLVMLIAILIVILVQLIKQTHTLDSLVILPSQLKVKLGVVFTQIVIILHGFVLVYGFGSLRSSSFLLERFR